MFVSLFYHIMLKFSIIFSFILFLYLIYQDFILFFLHYPSFRNICNTLFSLFMIYYTSKSIPFTCYTKFKTFKYEKGILMLQYFEITDTIYDITTKYPETIDLFVANGFENLKNEMMRKTLGKTISLKMALSMKNINAELFIKKLEDVIENNKESATTGLFAMKKNSGGDIRIDGVLPCPIRLPLLEKFENWLHSHKDLSYEIDYDLQSASMGLEHIKKQIEQSNGNPDYLSDLYLSAGFDLFFDKKLMGRYKDSGIFEDMTDFDRLNKDLDNDQITLKDPKNAYSIIGVVPAVFMVNTTILGDRPFPESWEDLMKPEFENSISIPMKDLDMFNAFLLHIFKYYGTEGVKAMGRNLLRSMHPSQMVKSHIQKGDNKIPTVTICPYFFASMADKRSPLRTVWPKDGAIISPIFLLSKKKNKDKVKPFVDFLYSKEIGEILSSNGKFPSTNPNVDNNLSPEQTFMWIGWDFIHENDIGELIQKTEQIFYESARKDLE